MEPRHSVSCQNFALVLGISALSNWKETESDSYQPVHLTKSHGLSKAHTVKPQKVSDFNNSQKRRGLSQVNLSIRRC